MENQTLYKFVEIKGGKKSEKFRTPDIKRALRFHKWYTTKYKQGLLFEISEGNNHPTPTLPNQGGRLYKLDTGAIQGGKP